MKDLVILESTHLGAPLYILQSSSLHRKILWYTQSKPTRLLPTYPLPSQVRHAIPALWSMIKLNQLIFALR
jgi:hypothetical protein